MIKIRELNGNGDFRSAECIEYLKQADVVVTNPPFSLFRQYVKQLMDYGKKFIIIGNGNAVIDKIIFPYIKNNEIWMGASKGIGGKFVFKAPKEYDGKFVSVVNGVNLAQVNNACWFTNIENKRRNDFLDLYKHYNEKDFPKYDNYDAIDSRTDEIPMDYNGKIGVPITFLDKYNPNQFEIIGLLADKRNENPVFIQGTPTYVDEKHKKYVGAVLNGKATYARILIRRKYVEN